jgi:hypothetical protein
MEGLKLAPVAIARSAASASSSASSPRTMTTALIEGLTESILLRWASMTSRAEACFVLITPASSVAPIDQSSVIVEIVLMTSPPRVV